MMELGADKSKTLRGPVSKPEIGPSQGLSQGFGPLSYICTVLQYLA